MEAQGDARVKLHGPAVSICRCREVEGDARDVETSPRDVEGDVRDVETSPRDVEMLPQLPPPRACQTIRNPSALQGVVIIQETRV